MNCFDIIINKLTICSFLSSKVCGGVCSHLWDFKSFTVGIVLRKWAKQDGVLILILILFILIKQRKSLSLIISISVILTVTSQYSNLKWNGEDWRWKRTIRMNNYKTWIKLKTHKISHRHFYLLLLFFFLFFSRLKKDIEWV